MAEYVIALESPRQPEVGRLLAALDAYLQDLYPPEANHILDIESLCAPQVRFLVVRRGGVALGCGALRIAADYGEVKRMYVAPDARGRSLGRALLERIEGEAAREGLRLVRLETGIRQTEALSLYRKAGYIECPPFGGYQANGMSVFLEKTL